jgi:hypothetical protein
MNKSLILALAAAATFAACSTDELVNENVDARHTGQVPIEFSVEKQNITRAANLESVDHYNFGAWAWKVDGKNATANPDMEVMNHYLVGWSNNSNKGYFVNESKTTTYATTTGSYLDHVSPWFYEGLGTSEYTHTNTANPSFYSKDSANYVSNNANQYLRYWDLAYNQTNFYCYAPYKHDGSTDAEKVTFSHAAGNSKMTFGAEVIRDGYDSPLNSNYNDTRRSLSEFMYAGVKGVNANLSDIDVSFKHMGAQLFIRFYEDIPGYKVEIIDLCADNGTPKSGITGDLKKGIQATPAIQTAAPVKYTVETAATYNASIGGEWTASTIKVDATYYVAEDQEVIDGTKNVGDVKTEAVYYTSDEIDAHNALLKKPGDMITPGSYSNGSYYYTHGATVTFPESDPSTDNAIYTENWTDGKTYDHKKPLMFLVPRTGTDYMTWGRGAKGNLTEYIGLNSTKHYVIQEKSASDQLYSYSPTIYYPVSQPEGGVTATTGTGFTFHVSYRIIAEDNKEVTTVHNATVHVPCIGNASATDGDTPTANQWITVWQPNVKYTYTFKITRNSNGTTNPQTEIDPTDPKVDDTVALYPIVFDKADIEDWTTNYSEYTVSEDTEYNQPY